ncbi:hypothetical protein ACSBR1_017583 [Camellia fascicularis]
MLLAEIENKDEDEDADFQKPNHIENSKKDDETLIEEKSKYETWKPHPHETWPEKKRKSIPFESQKNERRKVDNKPEVLENLVEAIVF